MMDNDGGTDQTSAVAAQLYQEVRTGRPSMTRIVGEKISTVATTTEAMATAAKQSAS